MIARRLIAFLAVLSTTVAAQPSAVLEGRVTSGGAAVEGATVRIAGTGRGAAADTDGAFRFEVAPGALEVEISAVGYETASRSVAVEAGEVVVLEVELALAEVETGPVVVTATRTAKALEDVATPVTVVDAETIREQGAVRLGDVLEDVPGLFLFDDHGSGLQIQGFSPDYTLVLLDGEPVVGRTAGTLDLDRLTVAGLDRVEVVEGPSSSLYGSEALAGVVNLVTALPAPGAETGSVRVRGGSYGQSDIVLEGAVGRERWAARALVNRFGSDGYDLTPDAFGPTVPAYTDWTADWRSRLSLGAARLSLGARLATQDQAGAFALRDGDLEVAYDDTATRTDWSVHPELSVPLSDRLRLTATLYGARYQTETRPRTRPVRSRSATATSRSPTTTRPPGPTGASTPS